MTPTASKKRFVTVRCDACFSWNRVDAQRVSSGPKCGKCHDPISLDRPLRLDDSSFQRTISDGDLPVLVDFYADWCAPCKTMAPFIDQLAAAYQGRAIVAKLDTDKSQRAAAPHRISGIPTTIVFLKGKEIARQVGAVPFSALENLLSVTLNEGNSS
jgi:thioredoxin 2